MFVIFSFSLIILLLRLLLLCMRLLLLLFLPKKQHPLPFYRLVSTNMYTQFHRAHSASVCTYMKYSHSAFLLYFKTKCENKMKKKNEQQQQQCDLRPIQKSALVCLRQWRDGGGGGGGINTFVSNISKLF